MNSIPSNLPVDKLDIFEEHVEYSLDTFALVKKLQKTEKEYNLFAEDYRDLHFSVRKKEKKIRKIEERIEKLKAEIRNLDDDKLDTKNKIELKIENYELEIEEIIKDVPENWTAKNKDFQIIHKAKNTQTKRYRKNVDEAYDLLLQISLFIEDAEKLENVRSEFNKLKGSIESEAYEDALSEIDNIFEKISEISGLEEVANKLDDLYSALDAEELNKEDINNFSNDTFNLVDQELEWRKAAAIDLLPKLKKYNEIIKNNIGLRLQSKLTKEQAKFVAACNSVHKDISLNF